jgi:hypothetical protein
VLAGRKPIKKISEHAQKEKPKTLIIYEWIPELLPKRDAKSCGIT